jgi:hypothetical protein
MTYNEYIMMIIVFLLLSVVFSMLGWLGYTLNRLEKRISIMMSNNNNKENSHGH